MSLDDAHEFEAGLSHGQRLRYYHLLSDVVKLKWAGREGCGDFDLIHADGELREKAGLLLLTKEETHAPT